jgi:hypothetical protein
MASSKYPWRKKRMPTKNKGGTLPGGVRNRFFADPKQEADFFEAVRIFGNIADAAEYVGVNRQRVYDERDRNPDFAEKLQRAKRQIEFDLLKAIKAAGTTGSVHTKTKRQEWRAGAWILERRNPQRYGRKDPNAVTPEMVMAVANGILSDILEFIPPERRDDATQKCAVRLNDFAKALAPTDPDSEDTGTENDG